MSSVPNEEITICIVEDDQEILHHLSFLLGRAEGVRLLKSFTSAESALALIPTLCPAVVLMDINLPGMTGIDCVRQLKGKCPETQVLMLTVYDDPERIFQALAAGASGYLLKRAAVSSLVAAIQDVHHGGSPFSSSIARKIVQFFQEPKDTPPLEPRALNHLSPREREVLNLLAAGDMYKEIAEKLGIALDTVRKHVRSIYDKLHVRSRTEALLKVMGNRA